ncbi:MAG: glycosyltransferase [Candidatus Omnitrophica bacterium]|nr:glycosyltransferase [Candidatus Omnitrophota bacterium]
MTDRKFPLVSFCMIVKNEEKLLPQCLDSIEDLADEIIIVDNGSSDSTCEIAERFGARIIHSNIKEDLASLRNIYLKLAKGEWILSLDADERISSKDIPKLQKMLKDKKVNAYGFISRLYTNSYDLLNDWFLCRKEYPKEEKFSGCRGYIDMYWGYRLFRNHKGLYYEGFGHETIDRCIVKKGGKAVDTDILIHHFKELKPKRTIEKIAKAYFELEKRKNAEVFKDHYRYYYRLGREALLGAKDLEASFKYLKKSIQLKPSFPFSYFLLGLAYKENRDYRQAILSLKESIKLKKDYLGGHYLLGIVYDEMDKYELAEKKFREALVINRDHPIVLNSLGVVLVKQNKIKEGVRFFKKALVIDPRLKTAKSNLRNCLHYD